MSAARSLFIASGMMACLAGCGSSSSPSVAAAPPAAGNADVSVTLDGRRQACFVALKAEPQPSEVDCKEIAAFMRDELRVPSGSTYAVRLVADFDPAKRAGIESALKDAGYRIEH